MVDLEISSSFEIMGLDPISNKLWLGAGHNGLVSLMYHSITPGKVKPTWQWALSFQNFCNHLNLLQDAGWTTISPNDILDDTPLPIKSVLITFDDGYADNFVAYEELAKRKMKATWLVASKDIGSTSSWFDNHAPKLPLLCRSQLLEMSMTGMTIGSHTHTHCRLTQMEKAQVKTELEHSRAILSNILLQPVDSFAYPYGLYNAEIISLLDSCGYKVAMTTRSGFGMVDNDALQVRRVAIMADDTLGRFARKMTFAANDVCWSKLMGYFYKRIMQRLKV